MFILRPDRSGVVGASARGRSSGDRSDALRRHFCGAPVNPPQSAATDRRPAPVFGAVDAVERRGLSPSIGRGPRLDGDVFFERSLVSTRGIGPLSPPCFAVVSGNSTALVTIRNIFCGATVGACVAVFFGTFHQS